jgi:hypothetical protein
MGKSCRYYREHGRRIRIDERSDSMIPEKSAYDDVMDIYADPMDFASEDDDYNEEDEDDI